MQITTDGNYKLEVNRHGKVSGKHILYVSGIDGGATMKLVYFDETGTAVDLTDGTLEIDKQYQVNSGIDVPLYVNVAGSTGTTAINVLVTVQV